MTSFPARSRGRASNCAPSLRRKGSGPRRSPLQTTKTSKRCCVRVPSRLRNSTPTERFGPFGRGPATTTGWANRITALWFLDHLYPVTDETTATRDEDYRSGTLA